MSADQRIVEALAGHSRITWGIGTTVACDCGQVLWTSDGFTAGPLHQHPGLAVAKTAHINHLAAVIEPIIREREVKGLRLLRRLAVRNYPKGLMKTATVIADIEDFIERTERNEDS